MFQRILNIIICFSFPFCVYMTFSVKHDVRKMQMEKQALIKEINNEKEKIAVYNIEWQTLSSVKNIQELQKKLMPEYKTVNFDQILCNNDIPFPSKKLTMTSVVSKKVIIPSHFPKNTQIIRSKKPTSFSSVSLQKVSLHD